ncbi:MAG TPA: transglutaminase-like domain-containing protein [Vicinamibacterales bacterium]|nr:transglutaminase-like domain-containing protein [Vicinamibacterales bacterium]
MTPSIADDLQRALNAPDDQLAPAALAIARLEHPRLDARQWLDRLDDIGRDSAHHVSGLGTPRERLIALNRYLFGALGFAGNREQYLDPRNSFLNDVLARRRGIPITLSIVYIEVGRRAGLPLNGIGFPGHFLVRSDEEAEPIVIDPFNGGALLSPSECLALLREHAGADAEWNPDLLEPATRTQIVVRMLNNLKRAYVALRSFQHAWRVTDLLVSISGSEPTELRDRGLLAYHLQNYASALRDLERYLALLPRTEPASGHESAPEETEEIDEPDDTRKEFEAIWEHVKNLRRRVASFN